MEESNTKKRRTIGRDTIRSHLVLEVASDSSTVLNGRTAKPGST